MAWRTVEALIGVLSYSFLGTIIHSIFDFGSSLAIILLYIPVTSLVGSSPTYRLVMCSVFAIDLNIVRSRSACPFITVASSF